MSIGIYKITNKINNKSYIGMSTNIEKRFQTHRQAKDLNKVLYRAIHKYGLENFDFSIIEYCSIEVLQEREKYWIHFYDSYNKGYNLTLGGDGVQKVNPQEVIDDYYKTKCVRYTAKNLSITPHTVSSILDSNNIEHRKFEECGGMNKKAVYQFDKNGKLLNTFESQEAAAKFLIESGKTKASLNTVRGHIGQNCAGKEKTTYGFIWKWV